MVIDTRRPGCLLRPWKDLSVEALLVIALVVVTLVVISRQRAKGPVRPSKPPRAISGESVDDLRRTLQRGQLPPPIDVSFRLLPGEECRAVADADVEQWLPGDDTYTHKSVAWAGGLTGLAIGAASNAVGNAARKAAAGRRAAETWRFVDTYRLYLTDMRLIVEGGRGREWAEIPLDEIRRLEFDGRLIEFSRNGGTPTRLSLGEPDYWYMLMRRLVLNEVPQPGNP
jgi:hypothetical protein